LAFDIVVSSTLHLIRGPSEKYAPVSLSEVILTAVIAAGCFALPLAIAALAAFK
jgi:hypothetical protein